MDQSCENTDRELWRRVPGDYYSPSLHVTQGGGIGMNVGGSVIVKPIEDWHDLTAQLAAARAELDHARTDIDEWMGKYNRMRDDLNYKQDQLAALTREWMLARHSQQNLHRIICEAAGYTHDPVDWRRDQVSLAECVRTMKRDLAQATETIKNNLKAYNETLLLANEFKRQRDEARAEELRQAALVSHERANIMEAKKNEAEHLREVAQARVEAAETALAEALASERTALEDAKKLLAERNDAQARAEAAVQHVALVECDLGSTREALREAKGALKIARVWVLGSEHYRSMHDDLVTIDAVLALPAVRALGEEVPRG